MNQSTPFTKPHSKNSEILLEHCPGSGVNEHLQGGSHMRAECELCLGSLKLAYLHMNYNPGPQGHMLEYYEYHKFQSGLWK